MDAIYASQRHIYDLTRKYYLFGRDALIDALHPPVGGSVLELGCGTARNLIAAARRYPEARFFGIDISREMLATARARIDRAGLGDRITLAVGDATAFDAAALFGVERFDRVFLSYALSMIPDWQGAIAAGAEQLAPGGALHIVDFGQQERWPGWWRRGLMAWLRAFEVTPRATLPEVMAAEAGRRGFDLAFRRIGGGYAWGAMLSRS